MAAPVKHHAHHIEADLVVLALLYAVDPQDHVFGINLFSRMEGPVELDEVAYLQ